MKNTEPDLAFTQESDGLRVFESCSSRELNELYNELCERMDDPREPAAGILASIERPIEENPESLPGIGCRGGGPGSARGSQAPASLVSPLLPSEHY